MRRTVTEQVQSMARFIDATRFTAATIDTARIGELIQAAERERDVVARLTDRLTLRHADLIASLNLPEGQLASIPSFASEIPTIDVFVHTEAVRVVTPHEPLETEQEVKTASLRLEVVDQAVAFLEITLPELARRSSINTAARRRAQRSADLIGGRMVVPRSGNC
jgi:hypothetical protein